MCDLSQVSPKQGLYLKLKGICDRSLQVDFDLDFYVHGTRNLRPFFKGLAYSHIAFNATDKLWYMRSLRDPSNMYLHTEKQLTESLPVGTYNWVVGGTLGFCEKEKGDLMELTLSKCFPNSYTCDSGECIELR